MSAVRGLMPSRTSGTKGLGAALLVPGLLQWRQGQSDRALVLGAGFVSAVGMSIFAWGTPLGLLMWVGAYALHSASLTDALRLVAFPAFARGVPATSTALALGVGVYGPALAVAWSVAWPCQAAGSEGDQYLIDRWAYWDEAPDSGAWVGYRGLVRPGLAVGRVIASEGCEVQWDAGALRVDGRALDWAPRGLPAAEFLVRVPEEHLLIASPIEPGGVALVPVERIVGRAWARYYPVQGRRLLH